MSRRPHPLINIDQSTFRESYRFSLNRFVRGSKQIEGYDRSSLRYVRTLGSGASGTVSLYHDIVRKNDVAVKRIVTTHRANRDQLIHEEDCLSYTETSEYIVKREGFFFEEGSVNIVLEYMDSGSLDRYYSKEYPIPDRVLRCIGWQLTCALIEIRKAGITHRDIKPANILLHNNGSVKLSDFGISKIQNECSTFIGTLKYMSPERLLSTDYSFKCDYWSMALVIMEGALGFYPIQGSLTHVDLETSIAHHNFDSLFSLLNADLVDFLQDWLKEERLRTLPQFKIKESWLRLDGQPLTKETSMQVVSEWLKTRKEELVL